MILLGAVILCFVLGVNAIRSLVDAKGALLHGQEEEQDLNQTLLPNSLNSLWYNETKPPVSMLQLGACASEACFKDVLEKIEKECAQHCTPHSYLQATKFIEAQREWAGYLAETKELQSGAQAIRHCFDPDVVAHLGHRVSALWKQRECFKWQMKPGTIKALDKKFAATQRLQIDDDSVKKILDTKCFVHKENEDFDTYGRHDCDGSTPGGSHALFVKCRDRLVPWMTLSDSWLMAESRALFERAYFEGIFAQKVESLKSEIDDILQTLQTEKKCNPGTEIAKKCEAIRNGHKFAEEKFFSLSGTRDGLDIGNLPIQLEGSKIYHEDNKDVFLAAAEIPKPSSTDCASIGMINQEYWCM
mmetsp:Transcript_145780/g.254344  ORF Transcript_145780/g.254344 Transcript_145780/m.254344 type:complete len:359 (-) Transcript_145780:60-1136(-)